MRRPFNRLGGPQYSEHRCGPRREDTTRFLVAASGVGYIVREFTPGEQVEPVFERWITYWRNALRFTVALDTGYSGP